MSNNAEVGTPSRLMVESAFRIKRGCEPESVFLVSMSEDDVIEWATEFDAREIGPFHPGSAIYMLGEETYIHVFYTYEDGQPDRRSFQEIAKTGAFKEAQPEWKSLSTVQELWNVLSPALLVNAKIKYRLKKNHCIQIVSGDSELYKEPVHKYGRDYIGYLTYKLGECVSHTPEGCIHEIDYSRGWVTVGVLTDLTWDVWAN